MNTLKHFIGEITDRDFDPNYVLDDGSTYHVRKASRGILVRDNTIAMLHVGSDNYHKLPGGGVEVGETPEEAFHRELLEEAGCACSIVHYAGIILEYRGKMKELQVNYIYFAQVEGVPKLPKFEQGEIDEGYTLRWIPISEVFGVPAQDKPTQYENLFIHKRDKAVLEYYKDRLKQNTA